LLAGTAPLSPRTEVLIEHYPGMHEVKAKDRVKTGGANHHLVDTDQNAFAGLRIHDAARGIDAAYVETWDATKYDQWKSAMPSRPDAHMLFDMRSDSEQLVNLAGKAQYAALQGEMRERLAQLRACAGGSCHGASPTWPTIEHAAESPELKLKAKAAKSLELGPSDSEGRSGALEWCSVEDFAESASLLAELLPNATAILGGTYNSTRRLNARSLRKFTLVWH
jgi:hypothetical protein